VADAGDFAEIGEIVTVRSDSPGKCPMCATGHFSDGRRLFPGHPSYLGEDDLVSRELDEYVNHLLAVHDGQLLYIGQETRDGAIVTVAVVGIPKSP
jgi:hypothetical protein